MAFKDYDFAKHQGISPSSAKALAKRFSSWQAILDAPVEQLLEVKGVGAEQAQDLIDTAQAQIRQEARKPRLGEQLVGASPDTTGQRLFVLSKKQADYAGEAGTTRILNEKVRRKLVTPAVCIKCGMDFVDKQGLSDWDGLSAATQDDLRRRLKAHDELLHGVENQMLIDEDTLDSIGRVVEDGDKRVSRRPSKPKVRQAAEATA